MPNLESNAPSVTGKGRELVETLLAFENDPELLGHLLPSERMLLWPFVRFNVLQGLLQGALGAPRPASPAGPKTRQLLRYLVTALRGDPLRIARRFDVLFFGTTVGVSLQRDGKWFGRINDYFALEHEEQSLVLDLAANFGFRAPRYPRHVARHDAILLRAVARARIAGGPAGADEQAIERFVTFLSQKLPLSLDAAAPARIAAQLSTLAARARFLRDGYMRLFDRTQPKLLFLEDGSYGGYSYIFKWARERGIRTAELQHGTIDPTNFAYNYGDALRSSSAYCAHLPEFLLTYGKFWSDSARTGSKLIEIGNPHFETKRSELLARERAPRKGRLLVLVSQPDVAEELTGLAVTLRRVLPADDEIVYRLHPNEHSSASTYTKLRELAGVRLSNQGDIYELLHAADAVIGCWSTALYEAAGLGRSVFIWNTRGSDLYVERSFGTWFTSADALLNQLARPSLTAIRADDCFHPDWRLHYSRFLSELGLSASSHGIG